MMNPHYYLMKNKKILRLEADQKFADLSWLLRAQLLEADSEAMTQDQANWRVAIFRDEIVELYEYISFLNSPESIQYKHA
jgi:hypothetical protein